jgi:AraC-like DNA-binding protein
MSQIWQGDSMLGFREVRRRLPIRSESLTQLGRGLLRATATVISRPDATLYYAHVGTRSSTLAELNSEYTGIVVPMMWRGEFVLNGETATPSCIYLPQDEALFQAHGNERTTLAAALPRQNFIATVAALSGVSPDDVRLADGALELAPAVMQNARASLHQLFKQYTDPLHEKLLPEQAAEQLTRQTTEILTALYLQAQPAKLSKLRTARKLGKIVRKAEECFAAAEAGPVSLADLCVAAGVSQVTLYHAFMVMCGSSPMAYFKKRRLTNARLALLRSAPEEGLVKRAALGAGLTHLGRFSAEYRELFGELPTTTLNLPPR